MDGPKSFSPLSRPLAIGTCSLFSASYVGVLYLFGSTRIGSSKAVDEHGRPLDRNHPRVIKTRLWSVTASSIGSVIGVWALARRQGLFSAQAVQTLGGIGLSWPSSLAGALKTALIPLAVTASLFLGPMYTSWLDGQFWSKEDVTTLQGFRNIIAAPALEELVFRGCIGSVGLMAGWTRRQIILLSPAFFGFAHVHHAYDVWLRGGKTQQALVRGLIQSAVQFSFTYVMGIYASFLFLRTGSLVPPILAHAFCNYQGLPDLDSAVRRHPRSKHAIYSVYAAGIVAFIASVKPATRPQLYGLSPFW